MGKNLTGGTGICHTRVFLVPGLARVNLVTKYKMPLSGEDAEKKYEELVAAVRRLEDNNMQTFRETYLPRNLFPGLDKYNYQTTTNFIAKTLQPVRRGFYTPEEEDRVKNTVIAVLTGTPVATYMRGGARRHRRSKTRRHRKTRKQTRRHRK